MPRADSRGLSLHLAEITKEVALDSHAVLILDGAGYHVAADLKIPKNITLMKLPAYSPELNPIENVWQYLRQNKLANTVFDDYDAIVNACCEAWNFFANDLETVTTVTSRSWATVNL